MATVLVTGGTGVLGRLLVPRLLEVGHDVRVLSRSAHSEVVPERVEAVRGNVVTGEGLETAVAGTETVVHAASSPFRRARRTEVEGTANVARVAAEHSPPAHVVYISIVGVDRNPLAYHRAKWEAEQALEASDAPWTILRATQFHTLLHQVLERRVVPRLGGLRFQLLDAGECADRLVELVTSGPSGRVSDMGGPDVLPVADVVATYREITGRSVLSLPIPTIGGATRAFRDGANLCPDHRDGNITWEQYLRSQS